MNTTVQTSGTAGNLPSPVFRRYTHLLDDSPADMLRVSLPWWRRTDSPYRNPPGWNAERGACRPTHQHGLINEPLSRRQRSMVVPSSVTCRVTSVISVARLFAENREFLGIHIEMP